MDHSCFLLSPVTTFWSNELTREENKVDGITKQKLHSAINHYKNKIIGCPLFPCSHLFNQKHWNLTSVLTRGKPQKVIQNLKPRAAVTRELSTGPWLSGVFAVPVTESHRLLTGCACLRLEAPVRKLVILYLILCFPLPSAPYSSQAWSSTQLLKQLPLPYQPLHVWPHPHHSSCSGGVPVTVCGEGLAEGDSLNTPVFKVPPDLVGNGLGVLLPFSILAPCCPSTRRNIISGVLVPWGKGSKHIRAGQGTARRAPSFKHAQSSSRFHPFRLRLLLNSVIQRGTA